MQLSEEAIAAWEKLAEAVYQDNSRLVSMQDIKVFVQELRTKWPPGYFDEITEQSLSSLRYIPGVVLHHVVPSTRLTVTAGEKVHQVLIRFDFTSQPVKATWHLQGREDIALRYVRHIGEIHDLIKELQADSPERA